MYNWNASADFNEAPERRGGGSERTKSLQCIIQSLPRIPAQASRIFIWKERGQAVRALDL